MRAQEAHHIRSIEPWLPPWPLNQSVKDSLSRARTSRMPPSGSKRALTTGEVPSAREFWTCSATCHALSNAVPHDDIQNATLGLPWNIKMANLSESQKTRE